MAGHMAADRLVALREVHTVALVVRPAARPAGLQEAHMAAPVALPEALQEAHTVAPVARPAVHLVDHPAATEPPKDTKCMQTRTCFDQNGLQTTIKRQRSPHGS